MKAIKEYILSKCSEEELYSELKKRRHKNVLDVYRDKRELEDFDNEVFRQNQKERFNEILEHIKRRVNLFEAQEDRIKLYKSFRTIISKDLSYRTISRFAYSDEISPSDALGILSHYYDENGAKKALKSVNKDIILNQENMFLISFPSEIGKWKRHLTREEPLDKERMKNETIPYMFKETSLVFATGGNRHKTSDSYLNRKPVEIPVTYYDDTPLYKNVITDGMNWINKHTGESIGTIYEFRLALIFAIRQLEIEEAKAEQI